MSQDTDDQSKPLIEKKMEDLFYTVRDDVQNQVEKLKVRHERFLDLVRNTNTTSPEFKDLRKEISKDVRAVSTKLKVMDGTVDMVEKNRPKFPHIKDPELASRKRIVKDLQSSIDEIKASIESTAVRRKVEDDANKANRDSYNEGVKGMGSIERENQRFIKDQQQVVKAQMDSQDIALVELGRGVDTLHKLGTDINQELSEQNIMLGKLETDVEDAQERMNTVQAALSKLLKTKDGCQIWTIVILFVILVILVALVIWT